MYIISIFDPYVNTNKCTFTKNLKHTLGNEINKMAEKNENILKNEKY